MNNHGGARSGAGRPKKWNFEDVLIVGQACEARWRENVAIALEAQKNEIFTENSDLQYLWFIAQNLPVDGRPHWLLGEKGEQHLLDIIEEIHGLNGASDNSVPPSRGISILSKPPRGTRKRIIGEIARQFSITESATDNLWQAYRRFERDARDANKT